MTVVSPLTASAFQPKFSGFHQPTNPDLKGLEGKQAVLAIGKNRWPGYDPQYSAEWVTLEKIEGHQGKPLKGGLLDYEYSLKDNLPFDTVDRVTLRRANGETTSLLYGAYREGKEELYTFHLNRRNNFGSSTYDVSDLKPGLGETDIFIFSKPEQMAPWSTFAYTRALDTTRRADTYQGIIERMASPTEPIVQTTLPLEKPTPTTPLHQLVKTVTDGENAYHQALTRIGEFKPIVMKLIEETAKAVAEPLANNAAFQKLMAQ